MCCLFYFLPPPPANVHWYKHQTNTIYKVKADRWTLLLFPSRRELLYMDINRAAPESNTSTIISFGMTNLHKKISNALLDWTLGPSTPRVYFHNGQSTS